MGHYHKRRAGATSAPQRLHNSHSRSATALLERSPDAVQSVKERYSWFIIIYQLPPLLQRPHALQGWDNVPTSGVAAFEPIRFGRIHLRQKWPILVGEIFC